MAQLDSSTRAKNLPASLLLDSSLVEKNWGDVAQFSAAAKGDNFTGLQLQLREIKVASLDFASGKGNLVGFLPKLLFGEEDAARKLSLPCVPMQEKYQTLPRKGCKPRRWRRVSRELQEDPLNLNVDFLVLATAFSLGIGSKISGDCNRKRSAMKFFGVGRKGCKTHRRAFESYLITTGAGGAVSNNRHRVMSTSYDGDQSEDRQSEEVQSAYKKDRSGYMDTVRGYFSLDQADEQNEENEWSWVPQEGDPLAESISSLQTTQEILESEMQKLSELGKEFGIEDSTDDNREKDVFVLPDESQESTGDNREKDVFVLPNEGDILELNDKMNHLEQKLKEASNTIRQKDLRLSKLQILISRAHVQTPEVEAANIDELETELEHQLEEKIEAEIQCLVMVKARQSWQIRAEDQAALKEHKLSARDDGTRMLLKLRDTESKILMLKEQVEKLEIHEKQLFGTTEVLRMQSRTFKICLFGLVQLVMLCLSLKMFFAKVSTPYGDVVPT